MYGMDSSGVVPQSLTLVPYFPRTILYITILIFAILAINKKNLKKTSKNCKKLNFFRNDEFQFFGRKLKTQFFFKILKIFKTFLF